MKFTREVSTAIMIRNVAEGEILIGETSYASTIALTNSEVIDSWPDKSVEELEVSDFQGLLETSPELIVLGTGGRQRFIRKELTFALARQGIGLEVMDTPAAARTFNVLAGEGRRVAVVLYVS